MAAVQEISMYAVDGTLTLTEEQRMAPKQFLSGKNVYFFTPNTKVHRG